MKEYKKPTVEVIEFSMEDVITTSGGPNGTDDDAETVPGSIFGATSANANRGSSNWQ